MHARPDPACAKLTRREKEVLFWLVQGKTNWEIAAIAGRSENTVKVQVRKILLKLDVSNRAQAAAKAVSLGLIAKFLKPCLAVIHLTQFALPILG